MPWRSALFVVLPMLQLITCNIEALCGSCWLIVLAPFRFPVLQVFPDLLDYPAVVIVIHKNTSYTIVW
jgi:hypothetical protein